jgi:hypothetical protein
MLSPRITPELLNLPEALPAPPIYCTRRITAETKTMAGGILHIHFPYTPGPIRGGWRTIAAALFLLLVKRIHTIHENGHPPAGLSLPPFTEARVDLPRATPPNIGGSPRS